MTKITKLFAAGMVAALLPVSASALGISVSTRFVGNPTGLADANADYDTLSATWQDIVTEDFETKTPGEIGDASAVLSTKVGTFTTAGGIGDGNSIVGDGENIAVRDNTAFGVSAFGGRFNTSIGAGDSQYLDSNDTEGFEWHAKDTDNGGRAFDRLLFTLVDVGDQRGTLTIETSEFTHTETISSGQPNGGIWNVLVSFSTPIDSANVWLTKDKTNDGFSIDRVGLASVPLPAAAWLLLGVSGALVAAKRRRAQPSV